MIKTGRNIPVDKPHVVAGIIFPHFPESHSPSLKSSYDIHP